MSDSTQSPSDYTASSEVGAVRKRRTRRERWWIALKKAPVSAWFGMLVIAAYVFVAVFAPLLAPYGDCLLYTSPSPRDKRQSRMPSSA